MKVSANDQRFEVWFNGCRVSDLCAAADDREGWCDLIFISPGSRQYVPVDFDNDNLDPLITRVHGRVRIENVRGWQSEPRATPPDDQDAQLV